LFQVYASVVIPTYNEDKNIGELITNLSQGLDHSKIKHEIIVVDDNSADETFTIVNNLSKTDNRIKLISRKDKRGIGSAIFEGFEKSQGNILVTMDGDFSHPPASVIKLVGAMDEYDLAIGSRYICGGKMNGPLYRRVFSKMLNEILALILGFNIHDCTGGFLAFERKVIDSLDKIEGKSGDFSFEIIYKARKAGFKIIEVPFIYSWRINGNSKTNVLKFGFEYIRSAINLRLNH